MRYQIILVSILLLVACNSNKKESDKQRFLIKGNDALSRQEYKEALRYYSGALALDSCYVDALNNIGIVYFESRKFGESVKYYDAALQCQPEYWDAYLNRASAFYELNELYRALDDLEYLQRKIPDSSKVYFGLGLVNTKLRKFNDAIIAFDEALEIDNLNAEILVNRGTVRYYLKEFELAENDLRAALAMDSLEANGYNALALLYSDMKQYDKALELVNKALVIEKNQPYFLNNRGYIHLQMDKIEEAEKDINGSIVFDPQNGWAFRNKGLLYMKKGNYKAAIAAMERAIQLDDFIDKIYLYLGNAYQMDKEINNACEAWRESKQRGEEGEDMIQQYCN
ncbi:MAG: tetratricopeptide repeat protein [Cyclobacteriaceae bacterium]|nr:tetratricopeptide repeat protein [Cyclobacteriaceae bacterium]